MGFFTFLGMFTLPVFKGCSAVFTCTEHGCVQGVQGVFTALLCSFSAEHGHKKSLTVMRRQAVFLFIPELEVQPFRNLLHLGDGLIDLALAQSQGLCDVQGLQVPFQKFLEDRTVLRLDGGQPIY